jgi:G patch domain-containing protein 1
MADDINQGRDTMTYTKPSIDIFKAIFASDDEDDSDDEAEAEDIKPVIPAQAETRAISSPPKAVEKPLAAEDLSSFKPVYRKANESTEAKETEKKKKKDKKKRKGVLSFDVGEEGDDEPKASRDGRKRKRKDTETNPSNGHADAQEDAAEGEWVEKPVVPISRAGQRKGAADFM